MNRHAPTRPHRYAGPAFAGLTVGLLGGSFDPAHAGHRHISQEALKRLGLDTVWWLVSPENPLKRGRTRAPLATRLARARAVAADQPRIVVTDLEARLGTRYTVATVAALQARFPRTRFVWLGGADILAELPRWRHWQVLVRRVRIAIFHRPSYSERALTGKAAQAMRPRQLRPAAAHRLARMAPPAWVFVPVPGVPDSATARRTAGEWPPRQWDGAVAPL